MHLLQSDIEEISAWVIAKLADKRIDLNEKARQILIAKAIGHWIQHGRKAMEETIAWEISLLPALPRPNDRKIRICSNDELRNAVRIIRYLKSIGCHLRKGQFAYHTIIPRSYNVSDVRKRLGDILKGME